MVTAYLGLLEKKYGDKLDGDAKKYMDFAIEGGLRARDLVKDLLEYFARRFTGQAYDQDGHERGHGQGVRESDGSDEGGACLGHERSATDDSGR